MLSRAPDAASHRPRTWYPFRTPASKIVIEELRDLILRPVASRAVTQAEIHMRWAEFKALVRDAQTGVLLWPERTEGITRHRDLFELRWTWQDDSAHPLRGYFFEPALPRDRTVLALVHAKDLRGDAAAINANQDAAMDTALARVRSGSYHDLWGTCHSDPFLDPRRSGIDN